MKTDGSVRLMDGYGNLLSSTGGKLDVNPTSSGGDGTILDGVTSSIKVTVFDYTNSNPLAVVLRDTNGDYVSVGGGTQYNQGTVTTDTDTLMMAGCVRADTAAVATGVVNGDRLRCITDSTGRLWTHVGAVDGTVTITGNVNAAQSGTWTVQPGNTANTTAWKVDGSAVTQPISGTVTTTPPSNATTNVTQFGGTNVSTGTGAGGLGIPRVTISNDSSLAANQSVNVAQMGGTATSMNTGTRDAGTQRVTIATNDVVPASQSGTWTVQPGNTANTTAWKVDGSAVTQPVSGTVSITANSSVNLAQVGATTVVNGGLAGSQSIGGTAANNASITANPVLIGCEALSSQPGAATTGNQRQCVTNLDGSLVVRPYGLITWSCNLNGIAATLTQCQAAPGTGLSLYITDVMAQSNTSTAATFTLRFGTGTNCGTGTGNLYYNSATALLFLPGSGALPQQFRYQTPIKVAANNAVCVLGVATNTTNIQITGFTAP